MRESLLELEKPLESLLMEIAPDCFLLQQEWVAEVSHKEAELLISEATLGEQDVAGMHVEVHDA